MREKSRELLVRHAPPSTCTGAAATSCANRRKAAEGGQHTGHPRLLQRLRHLRWLHRSGWAAWLHGGWRQLPLAYVLTKRGLGMAASPRESALPGGHLQELPVRSIIEALDVPWVVLLSMDSFYKVRGPAPAGCGPWRAWSPCP